MFLSYRSAGVCYTYLFDVHSRFDPLTQLLFQQTLSTADGFARGWTLQEIIAPSNVRFFTRQWKEVASPSELHKSIGDITGIDGLCYGARLHFTSLYYILF